MNVKKAITLLKVLKDLDNVTIEKRGERELVVRNSKMEFAILFTNKCQKCTIQSNTLISMLDELGSDWECEVVDGDVTFKHNGEVVLKEKNREHKETESQNKEEYEVLVSFTISEKVKQFLKNVEDNMSPESRSWEIEVCLYIQNSKIYFLSGRYLSFVEVESYKGKETLTFQITKKVVDVILKSQTEEFRILQNTDEERTNLCLIEMPNITLGPIGECAVVSKRNAEELWNSIVKEDEVLVKGEIVFDGGKIPQVKKDVRAVKFQFYKDKVRVTLGLKKIVLQIKTSYILNELEDRIYEVSGQNFNLFMKQCFEVNGTKPIKILQHPGSKNNPLKLVCDNTLLGLFPE